MDPFSATRCFLSSCCFLSPSAAFSLVGGLSGLRAQYAAAVPSVRLSGSTAAAQCGVPKESAWTLLRAWDDPDMPWLGFLLGQTPASIWYWCTDQMMVQRLLAAKSLSHAQGGALFAGFMKVLPMFLIVMPGMISRVLFTDEVACVDPAECTKYCQNPTGCSNVAYPRLVLELMPSGTLEFPFSKSLLISPFIVFCGF